MNVAISALLVLAQGASLLPEMPAADPAPFMEAAGLLDGLPEGQIVVGEQGVLYDPAAHDRLVLTLRLNERLSNDRAAESWRRGWLAGTAAMLPSCQRERELRLVAEAGAAEPQLGAALARSWWVIAGVGIVAAVGGAWVGIEAGR